MALMLASPESAHTKNLKMRQPLMPRELRILGDCGRYGFRLNTAFIPGANGTSIGCELAESQQSLVDSGHKKG